MTTKTEVISQLDQDVEEHQQRIRNYRRALKDIMEGTEEYKELKTLQDQLKAAQIKLRVALENNRDYVTIAEDLGASLIDLKDSKEILSLHLVTAKIQDALDSVPVGHGRQKPIVLKAKLGKVEPDNLNFDFGGSNGR